MRVLAIVLMFFVLTGGVHAQTDTPTPEPTSTPLPDVAWYGAVEDQSFRVDYTVNAGDIMIAVLLALLLFSTWGLMVITVLDRD